MKYIVMNHMDAEPMTFGEFKAKFPKSGSANIERDPADEGYMLTYQKDQSNEYVSWCPKTELEAVGHPVDGLTFGQAIDACRYKGAKIQRANWNGEGQFVRFESALVSEDGKLRIEEGTEPKDFENMPPMVESECFVFHFVNRKTGETGIQVGWLASQADLAASDWRIVE